MAKLNDLIVTIGARTRDFDKKLGQSLGKLRRFGQSTKRLGADLSRSLTMPIAGVGAAALKAAADLEAMEVGFISLTGGAEQASQMVNDLNKFAASTPYQIEGIAAAAKQLIASGTPVEGVTDRLRFLGDIAATAGVPIEDLASIFSKVNAKGKVELESLNQLAERGIPIFTMLSEATGLPADKLGAGAVSVQQFNSVLESMASEGGFAAGAMERLSQTAAGKFSTALDNLKQAGASMVESLLPSLKALLDRFTSFAQTIAGLSAEKKKLILQVAGVVAAIGPLLMILPAIVQGFMAIISPVGLVIAAIGLIVTAVYKFRNEVSRPIAAVINFFVDMYNEVGALRIVIGYLKSAFKNVFVFVKGLVTGIIDLFSNLGSIILAVITGDFSSIPDLISKTFTDAKQKFIDTGTEIAENIVEGVTSEFNNRASYVTPEEIAANIGSGFGLGDLFSMGGGGPAPEAPKDMKTIDRKTGLEPFGERALVGIEVYKEKLTEATTAYDEAVKESETITQRFEQALEGLGNRLSGTFETIFTGLLNGTLNFGEYMKETIKGLMVKVASLIAAFAVLQAITGGSMGTLGNFLGKGLGLGGLVPMASGGIVSGPTPILAGEYPGASSNPEVIAPLDKLQAMIAGSGANVVVTGKISGRDILLSSERANSERLRSRGF